MFFLIILVGAGGIEPPTHAGYRIYSPAPTIRALLPCVRPKSFELLLAFALRTGF